MNPNFAGLGSPAVSGRVLPLFAPVFTEELNMDAITRRDEASSHSFEGFKIRGPQPEKILFKTGLYFLNRALHLATRPTYIIHIRNGLSRIFTNVPKLNSAAVT